MQGQETLDGASWEFWLAWESIGVAWSTWWLDMISGKTSHGLRSGFYFCELRMSWEQCFHLVSWFWLKSVELLGGGRLIKRCCDSCDSDCLSINQNWLMGLVLEQWFLMVVGASVQLISGCLEGVDLERRTRGYSESGSENWSWGLNLI